MGSIYLAYDRKLAVERVVKEVRPGESPDPESVRQQFISEIHIIREIQHPGIPQILDLFSEGDKLMVVMEKIEGKTLQAHIREQGYAPWSLVLDWGIGLARILHYLHGKDPPIYHRDLKPENVILHPSGRLYLIDFGIAGHPSAGPVCHEFRGTIGYAAPEQYSDGLSADGRGDIYSLGRLLSYCLYGDPAAVGRRGDPGGEADDIPEVFRDILGKCTRSEAGDRYQTVEELLEDLTLLQETRGISLRNSGEKSPGPIDGRLGKPTIWIIAGMLILLIAGSCLGRIAGEKEAEYYLERAVEIPDPEKKRNYYRASLEKAPWKESIYRSILDTYVLPNHFSSREAVQVMNLLQEADALPTLKRQNPQAYARFCYDMGIGYFYQMGGGTGKMESELWFQRAGDVGEGLTKMQRIRASCYQKIGGYYRSFLYYGQDRDSEGEPENYAGFFETLRQLGAYSMQYAGEADRSSAWYAAYEVAAEIRDYAGHFLEEDEITEEILMKELEKMEQFSDRMSEDPEDEKKKQLVRIVTEAKKRVQIMEADYEKQNDTKKLADLSGSFSDAGNTADSHDKP